MQNVYDWIICYDIRNVRRLTKAAKIIESYAVRVQKSVFEVKTTADIIRQIERRVQNVIDAEEDFVLFMPRCEADSQKTEKYGACGGEQPENDLFKIL